MLPTSVIAIIKDIAKSGHTDYHSFSLSTVDRDNVDSLIGVVKAEEAKVEYVVLSVKVNASIQQKFNYVWSKRCSGPRLDDCEEREIAIPAYHTHVELVQIKDVMRDRAYKELVKLLDNSTFNIELFLDGITIENSTSIPFDFEAMLQSVGSPIDTFSLSFLGGDDDVKPEPAPEPEKKDEKSVGDKIGDLIGAITKGANAWTQIASAFKTKITETVKEKIAGKGFEYYNNNSQIQITKGLKGEYLDKFTTRLAERAKVPAEKEKSFKEVLEEVSWADSTVWSALETVFAIDTVGNAKAVNFWINHNDATDKYDFIYSEVKADFKLEPNVIIIAKSRSIAGGIFEDYKEDRRTEPRALTSEDVKCVLSFFQIVAFKNFCDQFNIPIEFPQ